MLTLEVEPTELFDERLEEFVTIKGMTLKLEHSLVSISKWESKWRKPFLDRFHPKTAEETLDYVRCMTLTQNVDPIIYHALTPAHIRKIDEYINEEQTATTFSNVNVPPNRQIVTSEIIYYLMFSYGIPLDCQKWHLSRLLTLIRVMEIKNSPGKKMSTKEILAQNKALNAARRGRLHSKG